jgi:hypothetical protein
VNLGGLRAATAGRAFSTDENRYFIEVKNALAKKGENSDTIERIELEGISGRRGRTDASAVKEVSNVV